ncbi:MAG TPA: ABC transporter permease [Terriglobales bacterium]|nr:ABC transporter permease [Terriglobales bacterium]
MDHPGGRASAFGVVRREALRALTRNTLRSGLSVLGVAVGIAAVICVAAIGAAGKAQLQQQLQNLGDNMVWVEAGAARVAGVSRGIHSTKSLTAADAQAILTEVPGFVRISPNLDTSVQTIYGNENWGTSMHGVAPDYFAIRSFRFDLGGPFTGEDVAQANNVCVLGNTVLLQLFGGENPIGREIRIKNLPFTVVGTLVPKGQSGTGQDQDDLVLMPYTTAGKKLLGRLWLDDIFGSVSSPEIIPLAEDQATALLHDRHRIRAGQADDFKVRHPEDVVQTEIAANQSMSLFLLSLGAISLLVGGIGIMNVMLASVTERTREIGVRLAVGATEADIQAQFLGEALLLSLVGAAIGIALGVAGSLTLGSSMQWPVIIPVYGVLLAVAFAAAVGVSFGYYPARLAARLDPIEALRFE